VLAFHDVLMYDLSRKRTWIEAMPEHINKIEALAYLRTSSMTNIGQDKDSEKRQKAAIVAYAKHAGLTITGWYADQGVSGADAIEARKGFAAMLAHIAGNGVRVVICENASRLARDLMVQEAAYRGLLKLGVKLIAADSPDSFTDSGPTSVLLRQILGSVSQFEKAALVLKLKAARDRKKAETGKCSGRKTYLERDPAMVTLARQLARQRLTLVAIADALAAKGHVQKNGKTYSHVAIMRMLKK
jgi:DNA invertase Pin-like site-specific DNA recombinase